RLALCRDDPGRIRPAAGDRPLHDAYGPGGRSRSSRAVGNPEGPPAGGRRGRARGAQGAVGRDRRASPAGAGGPGHGCRRLEPAASSDWKPVPKFKVPGAAAFERTFAGTGPFDRLLDALGTIESWPDAARVRSLSSSRQGPGKIAFTLEITAIRAAAKEGT